MSLKSASSHPYPVHTSVQITNSTLSLSRVFMAAWDSETLFPPATRHPTIRLLLTITSALPDSKPIIPTRELALDREARVVCSCGAHPNVRARRITHLSADCDALELAGKNVEHSLVQDEGCRAEQEGQLVADAVIIATRLMGGVSGKVSSSEVAVDVSAIKARDACCPVSS